MLTRSLSAKATAPLKKPFPSLFPIVAALSVPVAGYYYYSTVSKPMYALNPQEYVSFSLREVIPINHNTSEFRFDLPTGSTELGLSVASCLVTKFSKGTKPDGAPDLVIRPYTPIVDESKPKEFSLIVKKYENGPMSTHIHSLKPGQTLDIKGPIPKFKYFANEFNHVGMIAGGTGITPMLQVIEKVLKNKDDMTKVTLLFSNTEERDILLKEKLDALQIEHEEKFKVHYLLQKYVRCSMFVNGRPPTNWTQSVGYVTEKHIKDYMPLPGKGKVFICGTSRMLEAISGDKAKDKSQGEVSGLLKKMGYTEADVYKF